MEIQVTISKKYSVNTNSTTNAYEAESILDALKNNEINIFSTYMGCSSFSWSIPSY